MHAIPVAPVAINGRTVRDPRLLMAKLANVGASESGYEVTLAKLGLHVLQDRVTDLMPYFRGFQLLELSEDGEFAGGFFVFQANTTIIDAPMFLIKGRLKGKELLFLRDRQAFIPSQDSLIKYVLSLRDQSLGSPGPKNNEPRSANRGTPNIDVFSRANRFMQKVSCAPRPVSSWGRDAGVVESYADIHMTLKTAEILSSIKDRRKVPAPPLRQFLKYAGVAEKLDRWCDLSPKLASRVDRLLGRGWQQKVAAERKRQRDVLVPRRTLTLSTPGRLLLPSKTAAAPALPQIGQSGAVPSFLTGERRDLAAREYAKFGSYFVDERSVSQTKVAMDIENIGGGFSGPEMSGPAKVPTRSGTSKDCLVILPKDQIQTDSYASKGQTLVVASDGSSAVWCASQDLAVRLENSREPVSQIVDWREKLSDVGSLNFGEHDAFILFDQYGRSTQPLRSMGSTDSEDLEVRSAHIKSTGRRSQNQDSESMPVYCLCLDSGGPVTHIRLAERGTTFSYLETDGGRILLVPKSAKVLKLSTEKPEDDYDSYRNVKSFDLLPFSQLTDDDIRKTAAFTLSVEDTTAKVNGREMVTRDAIFSLMKDFGLHKTAAMSLIEQRRGKSKKKFAAIPASVKLEPWQLCTELGIKLAYSASPPDRPSYTFEMPEQGRGQSDSVIPVAEQYPTQTTESAPMEYADRSDPSWSGYEAPYEQPRVSDNVGQDSATASQTANDPDALWENSLFASLMRNVRIDSQIGRQVEALFTMVDTTGRTLFLMYAHQDEFEDAFGEKDLPLLEEQLLSAFEAGGELITDFLQRNIDAAGDGILMSIETN